MPESLTLRDETVKPPFRIEKQGFGAGTGCLLEALPFRDGQKNSSFPAAARNHLWPFCVIVSSSSLKRALASCKW